MQQVSRRARRYPALVVLALCLITGTAVAGAPYDTTLSGLANVAVVDGTVTTDSAGNVTVTTTDPQPTLIITLTPDSAYLPPGATSVTLAIVTSDGTVTNFSVAVDPVTGQLSTLVPVIDPATGLPVIDPTSGQPATQPYIDPTTGKPAVKIPEVLAPGSYDLYANDVLLLTLVIIAPS